MSPKFSVVIPAFNAAATLKRAIESVRAQSWPAHEIIVVDDGSSDDTAALARQYGDAVRFIQQTNQGVSVARNAGAAVATGDWLTFLDADDWYAPSRLERHARWIEEDDTLDFLTGDYEYRDAEDGILGTSMAQHESGRMLLKKAAGASRVVMEKPAEIAAFVADHFGDTHTLTVQRAQFITLGGYPTGFKVCEDVHFLTRLVAHSRRIGVICESLGVYVIHGGSATRRHPIAAQRENVRTLRDLTRLADNFSYAVRQGVALRMLDARYNLGTALSKSGQRVAALNAVLPSLLERPGWRSLRNIMSMLKG